MSVILRKKNQLSHVTRGWICRPEAHASQPSRWPLWYYEHQLKVRRMEFCLSIFLFITFSSFCTAYQIVLLVLDFPAVMSCWLCQGGHCQDKWCGTFCLVTNFLLHWSYSILLYFFLLAIATDSLANILTNREHRVLSNETVVLFLSSWERESGLVWFLWNVHNQHCYLVILTYRVGIRGRTNVVDVWWRKHKVHWIKTPTVGSLPEYSHLWHHSWTTTEFVPHIIVISCWNEA